MTNARQSALHASSHDRRTVMIVEGARVRSSLFVDALTREGFQVLVETRGDCAIPAAEHGPFDVVIVDRDIAGIDGFDLVSYVRHRFPGTSILFLTGAAGDRVARAARDRGATRCLEKTARVEELIRTVRDGVR